MERHANAHARLDAVAIAPMPTRRHRAALFHVYALVACAGFVALAVAAHFIPYFRIDLTVAHALQSYHGAAFSSLMHGMSWIGFVPQVDLLGGIAILALLLAGLRWEAVGAVFAACGVMVKHTPRSSGVQTGGWTLPRPGSSTTTDTATEPETRPLSAMRRAGRGS